MSSILLQSVLLEKVSMEVDFENCCEIVSLSDIEFVAQTHTRAPHLSPGLMVVHFESVGLKKLSMTLDNLVEMMSQHVLKNLLLGLKHDFYTLLYL